MSQPKIYLVVHNHKFGEDIRLFRSTRQLTEEDVLPYMENFEPDKDEWLSIHQMAVEDLP